MRLPKKQTSNCTQLCLERKKTKMNISWQKSYMTAMKLDRFKLNTRQAFRVLVALQKQQHQQHQQHQQQQQQKSGSCLFYKTLAFFSLAKFVFAFVYDHQHVLNFCL